MLSEAQHLLGMHRVYFLHSVSLSELESPVAKKREDMLKLLRVLKVLPRRALVVLITVQGGNFDNELQDRHI